MLCKYNTNTDNPSKELEVVQLYVYHSRHGMELCGVKLWSRDLLLVCLARYVHSCDWSIFYSLKCIVAWFIYENYQTINNIANIRVLQTFY